MRLVSYDDGSGTDRVGYVVHDDRVVDLSGVIPAGGHPGGISSMRRLLQSWDEVRHQLPGPDDAPTVALADVVLRAPVPDPTKVVAAPVNYRDHRREMELTVDVSDLAVFLKAPSSVIAHGGVVELPYSDRRVDQEGELAAVIGRRAHNITEQEALSHVVGYTGCLDITMRGKEDRSTRKSFDTFTPVGPWVVTADEIADPAELRMQCWVNETLRQDTSIGDLIFDVPTLVAYASSVMTLEPGDVIATGTPAGVGVVGDGDTITVEISRVGRLRVSVSAAGAIPYDQRTGADLNPDRLAARA
jgi:2-keto-4-pentenoate hydratase/2-oxohepta-3-ene-1,7-dioic acid hydratase in catechol pathway